MSLPAAPSLGSNEVESNPGVPDPPDGGDPRPDEGVDWVPEDEGPLFAWLPPEDRLWRHPSEAAPPGSLGAARPAPAARRWGRTLPRTVVRNSWAMALIAGFVGATAATGIGMATGLWPHDTTVVRSVIPSTPSVSLADIGAAPTDWTAIDDSVAASVVTVSVNGAAGPQVGSGLVFLQSAGGYSYVATDRSLFARGQATGYMGPIDVTFRSGSVSRANLIGEDPLSGLAVLEISDAPASAVEASLGTVATLRQADSVLAVGSRTATTISPGLISGEDRTVALTDGTDIDGLLAVSMPPLGVTATGGPLVDQFGQVVGLTLGLEPIDAGDQQLTFAVPIDEVSRIATEFINRASPSHPWVGITNAEDLPSVMAHQLGLDGGVQAGTVTPRSPAGQTGMRSNDIVTSFDGQPVSTTGALIAEMNACIPGHMVPITYIHAGHSVQTLLRVTNEPQDS
jgi:putative serine protease PepD